jgi:hypothetical protein
VSRSFSFSEVTTALDCYARHAFAYTGHLTEGTALKAKNVAPILREGRAWGAACAAWHATGNPIAALDAMDVVLNEDAKRQEEFGFYDRGAHLAMRQYLLDLLDDYTQSADRLIGLQRLEMELDVPIPSRTGRRPSSRYRFQCFIDGWWLDEYGQAWIVEFKLRGGLQPAWLIQLSRQMRWYTWGFWSRHLDPIRPVGVLVDERLNELPKSPRIVNEKKKGSGIDGKLPSHAKDQRCKPEPYLLLCNEYGVEPSQEALDNMRQIKWEQRVPILFRDGELEEAGQELITAGKLIRDLDSGELYPLRNARPANCKSCRFKEICPAPDPALVDMLFERVPPKRNRAEVELAAA